MRPPNTCQFLSIIRPIMKKNPSKSYDFDGFWSEWGDSNSRHLAPKASALPTAPHPVMKFSNCGQTCGHGHFLTTSFSKILPASASASAGCGLTLFPSWMRPARSQSRRATNCATPGYSVFLHDTMRRRKKQVFRVCGRCCGHAQFCGSFSTDRFPPQATVPRTSGVPLLGEWMSRLSSQITRAANYATFGHRYFSRPGAFFPTYVRQYTLRSAALALWHHLLLDRGQHDGFILYLSILPVSPPKSSLFASGRYVGKAVRRLWGLRTA